MAGGERRVRLAEHRQRHHAGHQLVLQPAPAFQWAALRGAVAVAIAATGRGEAGGGLGVQRGCTGNTGRVRNSNKGRKTIERGQTGQRGVLFLAADEHLDQASHQALAVLERLLHSKKWVPQ